MLDGSKIIRQLLIEKDMNVSDLALLLGINAQSARNKLNRNSFTLAEFQKVLSVLDCELQVITKDTNKIYR